MSASHSGHVSAKSPQLVHEVPSDLSLEQARARIETAIKPCQDAEQVCLATASGRILAADVYVPFDVPPARNSAMDGYALNSADLPETGERKLPVVGEVLAGHPWPNTLTGAECVRITTGGILPEGADTVVMQEHVTLEGGTIRVGCVSAGSNVRAAGEDLRQGEVCLPAGKRLGAAELGLLASLGIFEVNVLRAPRVALFSTGDELVGLGQPLAAGQIYDSNRYTLKALLEGLGCVAVDLGRIADHPEAIDEALRRAAATADAIISSGGVSEGKADYLPQAVAAQGGMDFWKVAMKPGRPMVFGHVEKAWYFGLPGNPISVMVSFLMLVRPGLLRLAGTEMPPLPTVPARCTSKLKKRPGRQDHQRGILSQDVDGQWRVASTGPQGSHVLSSMTQANCLIVLPPDNGGVAPGEWVTTVPLYGLL